MSRHINLKDEAERVLARMQGKRTYAVLIPCKQGHHERYARNGRCVRCAAEHQRLFRRPVSLREMIAERTANGELYTKL